MILIGIDDTDNAESKGTNQLAKLIAKSVSADWKCERIVRHQLLEDPRIPCTTRNGSASILLNSRSNQNSAEALISLTHCCREIIKDNFNSGSDPGLCLAPIVQITDDLIQFGYRCQFEIVDMNDAIHLADKAGIHLEGLGGTNGGMIGALAAIGLGAGGNDGRVVQIGEWFEDLTGVHSVTEINSRGVLVQSIDDDQTLSTGMVKLDKKLRPSLRNNKIVLFVKKESVSSPDHGYQAVRFQ